MNPETGRFEAINRIGLPIIEKDEKKQKEILNSLLRPIRTKNLGYMRIRTGEPFFDRNGYLFQYEYRDRCSSISIFEDGTGFDDVWRIAEDGPIVHLTDDRLSVKTEDNIDQHISTIGTQFLNDILTVNFFPHDSKEFYDVFVMAKGYRHSQSKVILNSPNGISMELTADMDNFACFDLYEKIANEVFNEIDKEILSTNEGALRVEEFNKKVEQGITTPLSNIPLGERILSEESINATLEEIENSPVIMGLSMDDDEGWIEAQILDKAEEEVFLHLIAGLIHSNGLKKVTIELGYDEITLTKDTKENEIFKA